MTTNTEEKARKAAGFVSGLLTGWGVPANWARVIAGAAVGALCACLAVAAAGCTSAFAQTRAADGVSSTYWRGAVALPEVPEVKPNPAK